MDGQAERTHPEMKEDESRREEEREPSTRHERTLRHKGPLVSA